MSRRLIGLAVLVLAGCASPPPPPEPGPVVIEVPGPVRYVPIPEDLLACPPPPPPVRAGDSNGALRAAYLRARTALETCRANLDAIRDLASPR